MKRASIERGPAADLPRLSAARCHVKEFPGQYVEKIDASLAYIL